MNLFRSEEHALRWKKFNPDMEKTPRPISFRADLFSERFFRYRATGTLGGRIIDSAPGRLALPVQVAGET
jgi:hypothetical protein